VSADLSVGNTDGASEPMNVSTKQGQIAELARRAPAMAITSLNHHLDLDWLRAAFKQTRRSGAVGIDGQTAADYEANLDENLRDLLERIKSGRYRASAVRRVHIPKAGGGRRPLGIPTFEDKVAQRAIVMLLEPIYEQTFKDCSFGFRPGRSAHQALQVLRSEVHSQSGRWILDVDLSRYFDTIDHGLLRRALDKRIADGVVRRMIDKWLKAGVLEQGSWRRSTAGTPQGGVISPLLANVFLHYALDVWFSEVVAPKLKGRSSLVRYADDFVLVFEDFLDCVRTRQALDLRMKACRLEMHPTKTKMVDFRFKRPDGNRHPRTDATTFVFLGFIHVWGKSRRGKNVIYQRTAKERYARALRALWTWCKRNRHMPIPWQHERLCRSMRGHYAYYGITGNSKRLRWFAYQVERIWHQWLSRRSRGQPMKWDRFRTLLSRYPLPPPKIVHSYI